MTIAPGDKIVMILTKTGLVAVKAVSPNLAGNKCLLIPDSSGKLVGIKLGAISVGDKILMIPDSSGKLIAVKCGGIMPNPPTGWTDLFSPGQISYNSWAFETWGNYIYYGASGVGGGGAGYIERYSEAGGWEVALDSTYYFSYSVYCLKVFGTHLYAGHSGMGISNGGIARSADGSYGSFAQVFDGGTESSYIQALETLGGKIYGIYYDSSIAQYKIISSANGTTWNTIYTVPAGKMFYSLTTDGTSLYTIWLDLDVTPFVGDVYSSTDGITWGSEGWSFAVGEYPVKVKYLNGHLYVGAYQMGRIYRDGVLVNSDIIAGAVWDFCECEDLLFAGSGYISTGTAKIWCSEDNGVTWILNYQPTGSYSSMEALGSLGKRFYAGSSFNGDVFRSPEIK